MLALALVALWPLATNHCQLEASTGLAMFQCAHSESQGDCTDGVCDSVESGFYRSEEGQILSATMFILASFYSTELLLPAPAPRDGISLCVTTAPPECPASRQFVFRTAAPPRAPSFVS